MKLVKRTAEEEAAWHEGYAYALKTSADRITQAVQALPGWDLSIDKVMPPFDLRGVHYSIETPPAVITLTTAPHNRGCIDRASVLNIIRGLRE